MRTIASFYLQMSREEEEAREEEAEEAEVDVCDDNVAGRHPLQ